MISRIKGLIQVILGSKRNKIIAIVVILVLIILIRGCVANVSEQKQRQEALDRANEIEQQQATEAVSDPYSSEDAYLLSVQQELIKSYGKLPEGYLWSLEGDLLSLGDKDMSAEEVVYAYLNGIRTLDLSIAQKYSRNSTVISTYEGYFDSKNLSTDYFDSFMRNMYKTALLSIQIEGIEDTAVFAENKQVFTVKVKMLDLTKKDFWEEDKQEIYENLYMYSADENDSTKGEMYLYDYVLKYYESENAPTRDVTFNLTVERYPDLDTGWLVSIDKDINDACSYTNGTLMVSYINQMFSNEGIEYINEQRKGSTGSDDDFMEY